MVGDNKMSNELQEAQNQFIKVIQGGSYGWRLIITSERLTEADNRIANAPSKKQKRDFLRTAEGNNTPHVVVCKR
jgi:hypothetical protein